MLNNNNDKTVDIVKVSQIHLCCSEERGPTFVKLKVDLQNHFLIKLV